MSERIGKREAWEIGLTADWVELRGREVWARDLEGYGDDQNTTLRGTLADDLTEEDFWDECREGMAK